jgi:DNA-directed RNA polymerase subunit beta'
LNPANGAPITVPSQDMVLGLYYLTKGRTGVKGEGLNFYSPEEATIAYNEKRVALHANIKVKTIDLVDGELKTVLIETTVGRVIFNQQVPKEVGFINELLTKKSLRDIIGNIYKVCGTAVTAKFLDDIKDHGFYYQQRALQPDY